MAAYRITDEGVDHRARVWTYRSSATYGPTEDEARTAIVAEAKRMVPEDQATIELLSIRRTPTGRYSAIVRRVRLDQQEA